MAHHTSQKTRGVPGVLECWSDGVECWSAGAVTSCAPGVPVNWTYRHL